MTDKKLWQFDDGTPSPKMPYEILKEYALKLQEDTSGMFYGDVVQTNNPDYSVVVAFYIIVPELRNYGYRLMEMSSKHFDHPYPVQMKLLGTAEGNVYERISTNQIEFAANVEAFIAHPLTKGILTSLKVQIDIYKDSRFGG